MSYEKSLDDMVGQHVAEFQREITMARIMKRLAENPPAPSMPYGYPLRVYRPLHICRFPEAKKSIAHSGATLSNGVPHVLSMDIVDQNLLGVYNPPYRRCVLSLVLDRINTPEEAV